ncbi:MAG: CpaF family protein [Lachnospiraceae bacterium]|mgnify:CR=1 FL=1|nr:CpaF family protein [Lachnospiraceae bacterium]
MKQKEEDIKKYLEERLLKKMDYSKEATDEEVTELIDNLFLQEEALRLRTVAKRRQLKQEIFYALRRLDILQSLLEDSSITEIMINGPEDIFIERAGQIEKLKIRFESVEKLVNIIQKIVAGCNRSVNEASPIVDARLKNGSRVNVVLQPIAINGPFVTIRRFPENPVTMEQMIAWGSITKEAAEEIKRLVCAGYNIFISGGTGSGKTTFLNVLSGFIPADERVITIEDSAELQLQGIANLVRMETRNENVEGCNAIPIRELIKTSLRMRPDRIIVGEVRGSEAIDMMTAFNTGHDGSMSTGHANSAQDMLSRLQTMILMGMELPLSAVKQQIASGIDIMVHLGKIRDKSRRVLEIAEVDGLTDGEICLHTLYRFEESEGDGMGKLEKKGMLKHDYKLKAAGFTV